MSSLIGSGLGEGFLPLFCFPRTLPVYSLCFSINIYISSTSEAHCKPVLKFSEICNMIDI